MQVSTTRRTVTSDDSCPISDAAHQLQREMDDDTRKDNLARLPIHRPRLGDPRPVRRPNLSPISVAPRGTVVA